MVKITIVWLTRSNAALTYVTSLLNSGVGSLQHVQLKSPKASFVWHLSHLLARRIFILQSRGQRFVQSVQVPVAHRLYLLTDGYICPTFF